MTEAEEIIQQLKNFGNGAHAHTANKCAYYLDLFESRTTEKINARGIVKPKNEWITDLCTIARKAMVTGNWSELKELMKAWW